MDAKTDYTFYIDGRLCTVRNVPCRNHHGSISFNMDAVGTLVIVRDKMLSEEIPYDVEYDDIHNKT